MKMSSLLLAISACCMLTPMAQANPSLARDWAEEAKELNAEMSHGEETALSPELVFRLQRFGRTASRLAISGSETTPLPHDLGCIFRGMAEEIRAMCRLRERVLFTCSMMQKWSVKPLHCHLRLAN